MESYFAAKKLLFERHLKKGGSAVINRDGPGGDRLIRSCQTQKLENILQVSLEDEEADVHLANGRFSLAGIEGQLVFRGAAYDFHCPMVGAFNAENLLLAAASSWAVGLQPQQIVDGLAGASAVPGRLELVKAEGEEGPTVFVDYAHTPDALRRALEVLRPLCRGRLITVFGCGGDRDRGKRPLMGNAVARGSDLAVVTSDNPRSESATQILADIEPGLVSEGCSRLETLHGAKGYLVEESRERAIALAIDAAGGDDVVLIAGKGHETYQILADGKIHFDDREQARRALQNRRRHP
jgi:UDP-N-acetylmuramoyl-L-alanyl-D-glutamate--2,6-diaminopimelate ligase